MDNLTNRTIQCRKNLTKKFDTHTENNGNYSNLTSNRTVISMVSLNETTRKAIKNSGERLSKTLNNVKTAFETISQKFRTATRRREILEEGPMTPNPNLTTPHTLSRQMLGRTPTKLYSPFGIESPYNATTYPKKSVG